MLRPHDCGQQSGCQLIRHLESLNVIKIPGEFPQKGKIAFFRDPVPTIGSRLSSTKILRLRTPSLDVSRGCAAGLFFGLIGEWNGRLSLIHNSKSTISCGPVADSQHNIW